jgi:hypothetical protein
MFDFLQSYGTKKGAEAPCIDSPGRGSTPVGRGFAAVQPVALFAAKVCHKLVVNGSFNKDGRV